MIQMWSLESTDTPMVFPITQWFGSGFGHIGFTSNLGACPPEAAATARFWSTAEPTPSAATTATKPAPTLSLCVITDLPSCMLPILFLRTLDTIHDFLRGSQHLSGMFLACCPERPGKEGAEALRKRGHSSYFDCM